MRRPPPIRPIRKGQISLYTILLIYNRSRRHERTLGRFENATFWGRRISGVSRGAIYRLDMASMGVGDIALLISIWSA